jgi:hypothetical protein
MHFSKRGYFERFSDFTKRPRANEVLIKIFGFSMIFNFIISYLNSSHGFLGLGSQLATCEGDCILQQIFHLGALTFCSG